MFLFLHAIQKSSQNQFEDTHADNNKFQRALRMLLSKHKIGVFKTNNKLINNRKGLTVFKNRIF